MVDQQAHSRVGSFNVSTTTKITFKPSQQVEPGTQRTADLHNGRLLLQHADEMLL